MDSRGLKMSPEKTEAYRTVSTSAVLVLASVPPIDLLAKER